MSARPSRHALAALVVLVAVASGAWATVPASAPGPGDRAAENEAIAGAAGSDGVRTASPWAVRPAPPNVDIVAAGDGATPDALAGDPVTVWDRLADCESGDWVGGTPQPGTARWDYGLTFDHGDIFEGGVNFHPTTWDSYKGAGMPAHAGQASRTQQITVAERVLADQGWGAWPVCSRMLGLR